MVIFQDLGKFAFSIFGQLVLPIVLFVIAIVLIVFSVAGVAVSSTAFGKFL